MSYSSNELKEKINPIDTYTPPSSANNSGATLYANEGFNINNFNFYSLVAGEQQLQYQYPSAPSFNTMTNFSRFGTNLDGSLGVMSLKIPRFILIRNLSTINFNIRWNWLTIKFL